MKIVRITEARQVCQRTAARGRVIVPHCWKSAIGIAASTHLAAASPVCPYIEFLPAELSESPIRKSLVANEPAVVDGILPLPTRPGLGVELNRDALERYCVR